LWLNEYEKGVILKESSRLNMHDLHILRRKLQTTSNMIFSKPTLAFILLGTYAAAQSCTLDFYFDLLGEFNCDGAPLATASADATSCADISTITMPILGKHWNAFKGVNVPASCSGLFPRFEERNCLEIPASNRPWNWLTLEDSRCIC